MKYILLLASVVLISACSQPSSGNTVKRDTAIPQSEQIMMKKDVMKMMTGEKTEWTREEMEAMKNDHMMMSGSDTKMDPLKKEEKIKKEDSKMMKVTGYMNYDEVTVKTALAEGQKVALFFHASWCPTCKALNTAIESDLSSIPTDTLIVMVDYDTSDVLKQKYGVTSQHTTVMIDKNMNLISKKLGAKSVSEILN